MICIPNYRNICSDKHVYIKLAHLAQLFHAVYNNLEEKTVNTDFRESKTTTNFSNEPTYKTAIALNSNTPFTEIAELSEKVKSMMVFSENDAPGGQQGKARICKVCGKEGRMTVIVNHIEANHITGIVLPCNICGKTLQTRNALSVHKLRVHKQ